MKRFVTYLALLAMLANNAFANVTVTTVKTVTNNAQGFDVWEVLISGYTDGTGTPNGINDVVANNKIQGIDGAFAATTGFMSFTNGDSDDDGIPDVGGAPAMSTSATGQKGAGVGSWINFRNVIPPNAPLEFRVGDETHATKVTGSWYINAGSAATQGLQPTDIPGGIRDNLLATVFVTTGSGVATFTGSIGTNGANTAGFGGSSPLTFTVGGNIVPPGTDPVAVTSTPANGASRTVGQTIAVGNAAAVAPNPRDSATISGVATTQGGAGTFTVTGISNGALAPGATQTTAPITFSAPGVLNGYVANGNFHFDVAGGATPGGTGTGPYNFPLTATVSGNSGHLTAPVPNGGSFAALSGGSGLGAGSLGSVATLLGGTASSAKTVDFSWRLRNPNETSPTGTSPPLPTFANQLTSDVLDLKGITGEGAFGDKFVLQMTYDQSLMTGDEATDFAIGHLFLASFDGTKWINAVLGNSDGGAGATKVLGAYSGQTALGTWGADLANNVVWAVLDHNSLFASVPEPSTIIIGLMGLVGLVGFARRRRG